jgi:uncharacterized protein involved in exopolysaccharide biosynthesis
MQKPRAFGARGFAVFNKPDRTTCSRRPMGLVLPGVATDRDFDLIDFAQYLRKHGRWLALVCGIAVAAAAGVSLVLPKRYTSTASILIEPPAGNDPRASTSLSPVYLDSLRTFERLASNDSLFVEALRTLQVPDAQKGKSIESLKRSILNVSKPGNTKILEIGVTLKNARLAQALAQYIAERTVSLSRSVDTASEQDVTKEARDIVAAAESRLHSAQAARDKFTASEPIEALKDEVTSASELHFWIRRDLADAEAELAESAAQGAAPHTEEKSARPDAEAIRARVEHLKQSDAEASRAMTGKSGILEQRQSERVALEAEFSAARTEYEAAKIRLNEIRASAVFRGERLEVIDPGIVPNQPSSPNLPLNIAVALVLSMIGGIGALAVRFGWEQNRGARPQSMRAAVWER